MKTTLKAIRDKSPCESGYRTLVKHLGGVKKFGETTPLTVVTVLDSNDLDDALWVLDHACGKEGETLCHIFACDCAEHVLQIYEDKYPGDNRPRKAIETKRRWIRGDATDEELSAAREAAEAPAAAGPVAWAAWEATWEDAGDAAWAARAARSARAAARAAWEAAREAAAWVAEREWQISHLRELLGQARVVGEH